MHKKESSVFIRALFIILYLHNYAQTVIIINIMKKGVLIWILSRKKLFLRIPEGWILR